MTSRYLTPNLRLVFLKLQDDERNMRIMECGESNNDESYSDNGSDDSDDDEEPHPRKLAKKRLKRK